MRQWKSKSWSHKLFTKYIWIMKVLQDESNSQTRQTAKLMACFTYCKMQSAQLSKEYICRGEQNHNKITDLMFFLCDRLLHFVQCCCMSMNSSALWLIGSYRSSGYILVWSLTSIFLNMSLFPHYQEVLKVSRAVGQAGSCAALISSSPALFRVFFSPWS